MAASRRIHQAAGGLSLEEAAREADHPAEGVGAGWVQPAASPGIFTAAVPADFITAKWDIMYYIEALDKAGNGTQWPDLAKEAPYVIVPLEK